METKNTTFAKVKKISIIIAKVRKTFFKKYDCIIKKRVSLFF